MRLATLALVLLAATARADFIDDQVNHATSVQVSCTAASSVISAYVNNVRSRTVKNQSTTDAFICMTPTCTTSTGTRYQENEGFIEYTYTGAISCVTGGGTATIGLTVR